LESITLGQLGIAVTFIVGLITGFSFLHKKLKEYLSAVLKEEFDGIKKKIDNLSEKITEVDKNTCKKIDDMSENIIEVDKNTCKNYLVSALSEIDQGHNMDDVESERFWEQYDHYTDDLKGNSYIHRKVEQLKSDGKL
jgi:hypothetical protein